MKAKVLKAIAITLIFVMCVGLIVIGALWLLNQYGVIDVQPFLDYLYYKALSVIAIISSLGIAGVLSFFGSIVASGYKIAQTAQAIDNKTAIVNVYERLGKIENQNDEILANQRIVNANIVSMINYEIIMANKNLSSAILSQSDKDNLKLWIVEAKPSQINYVEKALEKTVEIAKAVIEEKKPADTNAVVEGIKETVGKAIGDVDASETLKQIVKGMM